MAQSPPTRQNQPVPEIDPIVIEFCERNVSRAVREWLHELDGKPGVVVIPRGCLNNCTRCFEATYLRIDGRDIEGETHRAIAEEILGPEFVALTARRPTDGP